MFMFKFIPVCSFVKSWVQAYVLKPVRRRILLMRTERVVMKKKIELMLKINKNEKRDVRSEHGLLFDVLAK